MKKIVVVLSFLAVATIGVAVMHAPPAEAAPVFLATVSSTDAGPYSQEQSLAKYPKSRICLQPVESKTCFKIGRSDGGNPSFLPDCTKDPVLPVGCVTQTSTAAGLCCFDVAGENAIVFANVDAGTAKTNVYVEELNPPRY